MGRRPRAEKPQAPEGASLFRITSEGKEVAVDQVLFCGGSGVPDPGALILIRSTHRVSR